MEENTTPTICWSAAQELEVLIALSRCDDNRVVFAANEAIDDLLDDIRRHALGFADCVPESQSAPRRTN
jgi:hypothetical protein